MDDSIGKVAPTLKSCRKSSQVRNIEGIMIGKDGKPLMPIRPNRLGGDVQHVKPQSSNTETVNVETVNVAEKAQGDDAPHAQNEWDDNGISAMRSTEIGTDTVNIPQKRTFANVVNGINSERVTKKVNFRAMVNLNKIENSDFVLPIAIVKAVKHKFENSLVGFFVSKKVAFPLVKNYMANTWAKFGYEKIMSDEDGMFYFKFSSRNGLEQVLEQGPWLIRNIPLILTKWSPN
ncbi:retrovirus-related pol polyprotein from transposon TNT 1-94, partial [Tanacetum coccineum]